MCTAFETAERVEAQSGEPQDRVRVIPVGGGLVIAVADGAGGTGNGAAAAQTVIDSIASASAEEHDIWEAKTWARVLHETDQRLFAKGVGESTAVVVGISASHLCGAAVGDSQAWLIGETEPEVLTQGVRRKPLLGSGEAIPACFDVRNEGATLLVATDGLFNYAPREKILEIAGGRDLQRAARLLVDAARLPSGALQDDIGLALYRPGEPITRAGSLE